MDYSNRSTLHNVFSSNESSLDSSQLKFDQSAYSHTIILLSQPIYYMVAC